MPSTSRARSPGVPKPIVEAAHRSLARAEAVSPLSGDDLELLATAACMLGDGDEQIQALERAYHRHLEDRDDDAAQARHWLGIHLMLAGSVGRASGWLSRAERQMEQRDKTDSAGYGYLLLPTAMRKEAGGDFDGAIEAARAAAEIGERFRDADLVAIARQAMGNFLIIQGRPEEGIGCLDEAMLP